MWYHEIVRPLCAQGAPLPQKGAGAEINELGKSEAVCPAVEDPKQEPEIKQKPTMHTGQVSWKHRKRNMTNTSGKEQERRAKEKRKKSRKHRTGKTMVLNDSLNSATGNRIVFEHGIIRLLCAQGAPPPNWDAGAEMKELGKAEAVWPTVEDPKTETEPKRTKPTQHTGQGYCSYPAPSRLAGAAPHHQVGGLAEDAEPLEPMPEPRCAD